jgi:hypothetical protein
MISFEGDGNMDTKEEKRLFLDTLRNYHLDSSVIDGLKLTRAYLIEHVERLKTETMTVGDKLVLDYMLYSVLTQLHDDQKAFDFCKLFLEYGAKPYLSVYVQADSGVMNQAAERTLELVELIHQYGGNINHDLYGQPGCWPLISAVCGNHVNKKGNLEIVKYLVENGAVVNFINYWGSSPLDYANNQPEIYEYLKSMGAKHGSELPRDHLDKILNQQVESVKYENLIDHLKYFFDSVEYVDFPLGATCDPPLRLIKGNFEFENANVPFYVTEGMSSRAMNTGGAQDGVQKAEMMIILQLGSDHGVKSDNHQNAINWLKVLAQMPFDTNQCYREVNLIPNGKPPKPIFNGYDMNHIYVRTAVGDGWEKWVKPNGEVVSLMIASVIYQEEFDYFKTLMPAEIREFMKNEIYPDYIYKRKNYLFDGINILQGKIERRK